MTADRPLQPRLRHASEGSADHGRTLRQLAECDGITAPLREATAVDPSVLDARTAALACLAALVALRAAPASYRRCVDVALAAGASVDEVVGTLKIVARTVGLARVVSAAPGVALAVGYDVDAALEAMDDPTEGDVRGPVRVVGGRPPRRGG